MGAVEVHESTTVDGVVDALSNGMAHLVHGPAPRRRTRTSPDATCAAAVDLPTVRDAYASRSGQYIDLFGGDCPPADEDVAFVERHLTGLPGTVLDLGCGPGQWTAHLHSCGAEVTGVDVVPEFIAHARATRPGPRYELGSMTDVAVPAGSVAGVLAWYSTIHVPPGELGDVLVGFRRLLRPAGVLVLGFFDSDDGVAAFDHAVVTAYRWPVDVLSAQLAAAGLVEVERLQQQLADRPDRRYAAVAARAV